MTSADTLRMHLLILNTDRSDGGLMLQFSPIQTVHNFRARALNFIGAAAHAHTRAHVMMLWTRARARSVLLNRVFSRTQIYSRHRDLYVN